MTDGNPILPDDHEARRLLVSVPVSIEGSLSPEERVRIVDALATHRSNHKLTHSEIAQGVALKGNTISEILSGAYERKASPTTFDQHLRALNQWMEQDARRRAGQDADRPLTTTLVVRLVKTAVNMCRQQVTMGYVTGPAGVGKTATVMEIMSTERGSLYVLTNRSNRAPSRMESAIADLLKVGRKVRTRKWRGVSVFDRLQTLLQGSHRLLVVDDAHKLPVDTLELLREMHDAFRIPVLLLGEFKLAETINATTGEDSGQLESRFGVKLDVRRARINPNSDKELDVFTAKEISEIVRAPGLRFSPGAIAYLHDLANTHGRGGIRAVKFMIPLAARIARKRSKVADGKTVTIDEDALRILAGEQDKTMMEPLAERYERARSMAKTA